VSDRVCLRCDWSGRSEGDCPRCGASLYELSGPPPAAEPDRVVRDRPERQPVAGRSPAAARRPGRLGARASVVLVVVLAATVGAWVFSHPPSGPADGDPPIPGGLAGTLVYAVGAGDGTARLWRWDLSTGELRRGPAVASPVELIDAYAASPGWIGVTSRVDGGGFRASVLRFLQPRDRAVPLIEGDRIAWDGRGMSVAALQEGQLVDGCLRDVSIDLVRLVTSELDRQFTRARLCGRVTTLGRASLVTFFTMRRAGRTDVFYAGVHPHRILRDHTMVSVSPTSDLLVVPTPGDDDTYGGAEVLGGDVSLFFRGLGDAGPIAYGTPARPFELERVLAWTTDSLSVIVEGRWGDLAGLFVLDGGAGDGLDRPHYLGPSSGRAAAAFSDRGVAFVADGRVLSYVRDGVLVPLRLPADAPAPDGPVVWVR
jgi:hypothetical protein